MLYAVCYVYRGIAVLALVFFGEGAPPKFADLPAGQFFLERRSATDWEISAIDVPQPDKIENVKVSPAVLAEGKRAEVTWNSSKLAQVEVLDASARPPQLRRGLKTASLQDSGFRQSDV